MWKLSSQMFVVLMSFFVMQAPIAIAIALPWAEPSHTALVPAAATS